MSTIGDRSARPRRGATAIAVALLLQGALFGPSFGQGADCDRLRTAIRDAESGAGQRDSSAFDRAAEQQRFEIRRTERYAAQIGCDGRGAEAGEDGPPPECTDIEDRLARMQDNLGRMETRANQDRNNDAAARQAALLARYNATCAGASRPPQAGDLDEGRNQADPGTANDPDDLSTVPLNGDIMQDGSEPSHVAGRTVCVRTCDGGYFPLAPQATTDQLDGLEQLCKASCPNTEARLYTMRGDDLASATANDGSPYTALPAAFSFEKTAVPSCTCKPPNQSWAEALAGAEQMLEKGDRRDVTVTTALSDKMARPLAPSPGAPAARTKKVRGKPAQVAAAPAADAKGAVEGMRAAQAPTASHESAGIGGPAAASRVLGRSDGLTTTTAGPDGVTRRIRLIVP